MATLKNTTINDTGFIKLPIGNTSQRPSNPEVGQIRFNTDLNSIEGYSGAAWGSIGGGVEISENSPAAPIEGDLWWDSSDGNLYVYYDDGDSQQWVATTPASVGPEGPKGDDGADPTITVGNVSDNRDPSQSPTVSNTGTSIDAVFDFDFSRNPTFSIGSVTTSSTPSATITADSAGDLTLDFVYPEPADGITTGKAIAMAIVFG